MPHLVTLRASRSLLIALTVCSFSGWRRSDAATPVRVPVQFSITQDVGSGNEVFVSGTHPDLSSGGIQQWGVKLNWSSGNVWSGSIAIEAGAQISYSYVSHPLST